MKESIVTNEQQLLKLLIEKPENILKIEKFDYFLSPISETVSKTIFELYEKKLPINIDNIIVEGNPKNSNIDINILKLILEKEYIDFDHHYNKLKHNYIKDRYNYAVLRNISKEFSVRDDLDVSKIENLIGTLQDYVYELKDHSSKKILSLREAYDVYESLLYDRMTGERNFSYGCPYLTNYIYRGAQPGEMTAIYSTSGMGKSTYDLYLFNKQMNLQIPSMYFTPENSLELSIDRVTCMKHKIPFKLLYPNINEFEEIPDFIFNLIKKEKRRHRRGDKAFICDDPIISIRDLEKYIIEYQRIYGFNYMICHLDLASMFKEFNLNSGSKASDYENALNQLHFVAKKTGCHFILIFQSRRPSDRVSIKKIEDLDKLKPQIEMIKNSGAVEERCRIILGLFRRKHFAKKYLPDDPETEIMDDIMEVYIQKQNTGNLGVLKYLYDPETYYIGKYIEPEEEKAITID